MVEKPSRLKILGRYVTRQQTSLCQLHSQERLWHPPWQCLFWILKENKTMENTNEHNVETHPQRDLIRWKKYYDARWATNLVLWARRIDVIDKESSQLDHSIGSAHKIYLCLISCLYLGPDVTTSLECLDAPVYIIGHTENVVTKFATLPSSIVKGNKVTKSATLPSSVMKGNEVTKFSTLQSSEVTKFATLGSSVVKGSDQVHQRFVGGPIGKVKFRTMCMASLVMFVTFLSQNTKEILLDFVCDI